jgi:eukaryotic-like serine/threonine-protein kinase
LARDPGANAPLEDHTWNSPPKPPESALPDATPTPSGVETPDPHRTRPHNREGSAEWDALPAPVLQVGQVAFGKYRLIEKIGEGGMGEVWRVWHLNLEAERALKLIKPELAQNDKGWRRFQREARLMAKINHPNNVSVNDFGRAQSVGYIEMEYVRGRSLTEVLKDNGEKPMSAEWTAQILDQLCEVLQEAHGHTDEKSGEPRPIIHRDLKPSNLMLVERKGDTGPPRLKVLDFGIAKIAEDEGSPELTGAGDLVGTPAFMSPEQIRGGFEKDGHTRDIDGRSDLYSTGVMLYQLLTGALPFRGSKMSLLAAHLNNAPLPMKEANPKVEVPPAIEQVVLHCLEKDPAKRPQTARELAEEFRRAAGIVHTGPPPPSPPWRTVAAAAAVVLIAGIGVGAMMMSRRPPPKDGSAGGSSVGPIEVELPRVWVPPGYKADDPSHTAPGRDGFAYNLKRQEDGVEFVFVRDHVYIPTGYKAESLEDQVGAEGWPRVIIRARDGTRFIRIESKVYLRGDPNRDAPALDKQGKELKPHFVRVRGFYIQETEVTNGEFETYAKASPTEPGVKKWLDGLARFRSVFPNLNPSMYPAVEVDYRLATRYALSVGGLLPTEAEWELAAKSRNESYSYAWGADWGGGDGAKARVSNPDDPPTNPAPVDEYKKQYKQDETEQHVSAMVGNVRELCVDRYVPYTEMRLADNAPKAPLSDERLPVDLGSPGTRIVVRGGSFLSREDEAKAFNRSAEPPDAIPPDVGFRVVIECPAKAETSP